MDIATSYSVHWRLAYIGDSSISGFSSVHIFFFFGFLLYIKEDKDCFNIGHSFPKCGLCDLLVFYSWTISEFCVISYSWITDSVNRKPGSQPE